MTSRPTLVRSENTGASTCVGKAEQAESRSASHASLRGEAPAHRAPPTRSRVTHTVRAGSPAPLCRSHRAAPTWILIRPCRVRQNPTATQIRESPSGGQRTMPSGWPAVNVRGSVPAARWRIRGPRCVRAVRVGRPGVGCAVPRCGVGRVRAEVSVGLVSGEYVLPTRRKSFAESRRSPVSRPGGCGEPVSCRRRPNPGHLRRGER